MINQTKNRISGDIARIIDFHCSNFAKKKGVSQEILTDRLYIKQKNSNPQEYHYFYKAELIFKIKIDISGNKISWNIQGCY